MKLYLLEQNENQSEGSIASCVVVANSKEEAQQVHPFTDWDRVEVWTYGPEDVQVTYLGNARKDIEKAGFSENINNVVCLHRCYS